METKHQMRKRHLAGRNALLDEEISRRSLRISEHLKNFLKRRIDFLQKGICAYYPLGAEVSLLLLYVWLLEKNVPMAFPKVCGDVIEFYRVDTMEDFSKGNFGIMEPVCGCMRADWAEAVCLVPGAAFDRTGGRLGYGKGYYDRFFACHPRIFRIGIAYESQLEERIPTEEYDKPMHALATEEGIAILKKGEGLPWN